MLDESEKRRLVLGAGSMIGVWVLGLNGPFLFQSLGLNVPEAAAAGTLVGAALGYLAAEMMLWVGHWRHVRFSTHAPHGAATHHHA